jgi:hypothetical protein
MATVRLDRSRRGWRSIVIGTCASMRFRWSLCSSLVLGRSLLIQSASPVPCCCRRHGLHYEQWPVLGRFTRLPHSRRIRVLRVGCARQGRSQSIPRVSRRLTPGMRRMRSAIRGCDERSASSRARMSSNRDVVIPPRLLTATRFIPLCARHSCGVFSLTYVMITMSAICMWMLSVDRTHRTSQSASHAPRVQHRIDFVLTRSAWLLHVCIVGAWLG